jgi:transposase
MAGAVRKLNKIERSELTRLMHSGEDGRIVRRAQMIRLSSQGVKVPEIAAAWDVTVQTVLKTLHRFDTEGLERLVDRPRGGRPAKVTDKYVEVFKDAVQRSPRDPGCPFGSWTLTRLREHIGHQTGVSPNLRFLSALTAKHGIVYRRPRRLMAHLRDLREYDKKEATFEFPKRTRSSQNPISLNSGINSWCGIGTPCSSWSWTMPPITARQEILDLLVEHETHVQVIWLPAYSPELNMIEGLWGNLKQISVEDTSLRRPDVRGIGGGRIRQLQQRPETVLSLAHNTARDLRKTAQGRINVPSATRDARDGPKRVRHAVYHGFSVGRKRLPHIVILARCRRQLACWARRRRVSTRSPAASPP